MVLEIGLNSNSIVVRSYPNINTVYFACVQMQLLKLMELCNILLSYCLLAMRKIVQFKWTIFFLWPTDDLTITFLHNSGIAFMHSIMRKQKLTSSLTFVCNFKCVRLIRWCRFQVGKKWMNGLSICFIIWSE